MPMQQQWVDNKKNPTVVRYIRLKVMKTEESKLDEEKKREVEHKANESNFYSV